MGQAMKMTRELYGDAYQSGHERTVNFLLSKGFPAQTAEEAAQAAWVRGWERKEQLRDTRKALPWVNSIALNMGRSQLRKDSRMRELEDNPVSPFGGMSAAIDVERALRECSEKDRQLLERRYLEDWDIRDLADRHRCSSRAIRVRLHRARRRVQGRLEGLRTS